jgi:hypothetical protein
MTDVQSAHHSGRSKKSTSWGSFPAPFIDSMIDMQKQVLDYAAEFNEAWTSRAQSESRLIADLMGRLAASRSIPDAASAWQECMQRQLQLNAEDARRLLDQNKKFMRVGAELFSNGGPGVGS